MISLLTIILYIFIYLAYGPIIESAAHRHGTHKKTARAPRHQARGKHKETARAPRHQARGKHLIGGSDTGGDTTSLHLVTAMLLHRESSWKNEDEPISWITSPHLDGIKKTIYSPDQYVHAHGDPHRNLIMKTSALNNGGSFTPWIFLFQDLNLTKHDIEVLPIINPGKAQECAGYSHLSSIITIDCRTRHSFSTDTPLITTLMYWTTSM
mgnify:CR=1 FL=1